MALELAPTLEIQETPTEKKEEISSLFGAEVKISNPIESIESLSKEAIEDLEIIGEVGPAQMIKALGQNITGEVFGAIEDGEGSIMTLNTGSGIMFNPENGATWFQQGKIDLDATGEQIKGAVTSGNYLEIRQKFQSHLDVKRSGLNFSGADDYEEAYGADDAVPELYRVPLVSSKGEPMRNPMYVPDIDKGEVDHTYSVKGRHKTKKRRSEQDASEVGYARETHNIQADQVTTPEESVAKGSGGKKYAIERAIESTGFIAKAKKGIKNSLKMDDWDPELSMRDVIYEETRAAMSKLAFKQKIMFTEKNFEDHYRPMVSIPGKLHVLQVINPQKPGIIRRRGKLKVVRGAEIIVVAKDENGKWKGAGFGRGASGWRIDAWMKNKKIDL